MDLEHHQQYSQSEKMFLLTLEYPGRHSFLPKMGALAVLLGSILMTGSVTVAAQQAPKTAPETKPRSRFEAPVAVRSSGAQTRTQRPSSQASM
jgi:hypothetical protein